MNPLSNKPQITTAAAVTGPSVTKGGAKNTGLKTPAKVKAPVTPTAIKTSENGVQKTTNPDGSIAMQSDSGVKVDVKNGVTTVKLAEGGAHLELKDGEVKSLNGEAETPVLIRNDEGVDLISFADKKGDMVQVDPDSLVYEVVRKEGGGFTSQVMYPDGLQELVVSGRERQGSGELKDYSKRALFNQEGSLVKNSGFEGLNVKDGKASFKLSNGASASRALPRSLPGQEAPAETKTADAPVSNNSAPVALLAEEPFLAAPTTETPAAPTAKELEATAKAKLKARMDELKKVGPDFFTPGAASNEAADIQMAPNGLTRRMADGEIAFSLPNGDQFRTKIDADSDNDITVALGENPRAKNPKMVQEDDGRTLLTYSDKNRNSYQLDIMNGDYTVTNADGSLVQKFNPDGSQEISARSVHTTEAGSRRPSEHNVKFDADGKLVEKSGFEDLEVDAKSLVYTLPNGKPTVRNLMDSTDVRFKEEKSAPAVSSDWGDTQSLVDSILGKAAPVATAAAATPVSEAQAAPKVAVTSTAKEATPVKTAASGVSRVTLEDGTVVTKLPNGLSFHDGGEEGRFAVDKEGNRLEVHTRDGIPSKSGYVMYAKGKDGVGYTITPDALDMIAESKDGKVHQQLWENGAIETKIKDGEAQHAHVADPQAMLEHGSPWIYMNPSEPNRLFVKDQANTSYELPLTLPTGPPQNGGPGPMSTKPLGQGGPGEIPQQGTKPSFWEKTKAFFRGDSPPQYGNNGYPPNMTHGRGMPSSQHQYDPVQQQMHQMQRETSFMNKMTMVSMGVGMLSSLAYMPGMFFGGGMGGIGMGGYGAGLGYF